MICRSTSLNDKLNFHLKNFTTLRNSMNYEPNQMAAYNQYPSYFNSFSQQNMFYQPDNHVPEFVNKPY